MKVDSCFGNDQYVQSSVVKLYTLKWALYFFFLFNFLSPVYLHVQLGSSHILVYLQIQMANKREFFDFEGK